MWRRDRPLLAGYCRWDRLNRPKTAWTAGTRNSGGRIR
ncbi:hypothetical protein THIOKS12000044 [Thiocapsa sp. KS1]|nr:hypothetical protein THIOKS12000044 [Thiocapsa sp. KS1]